MWSWGQNATYSNSMCQHDGYHNGSLSWWNWLHMTYLLEPPRPRDIGWRISPAISSSHAGTSCFDSTNSSSKSLTKFLFLSLKNDVAVPKTKQIKSDQKKPRKSFLWLNVLFILPWPVVQRTDSPLYYVSVRVSRISIIPSLVL